MNSTNILQSTISMAFAICLANHGIKFLNSRQVGALQAANANCSLANLAKISSEDSPLYNHLWTKANIQNFNTWEASRWLRKY